MSDNSVGAVFILELDLVKIVNQLLKKSKCRRDATTIYNDAFDFFLDIPNVHLRKQTKSFRIIGS